VGEFDAPLQLKHSEKTEMDSVLVLAKSLKDATEISKSQKTPYNLPNPSCTLSSEQQLVFDHLQQYE
jgi:hypothetical protein